MDEETVTDLVLDLVSDLQEHGNAGSYVESIVKAIRTGGFPWRTYIFRSYFDTQLLTAEARRLIIRDFRAFFMGHAGDIERTYTLNKHKLPEDMIDEMREAYRRCQPLLQSYGEARRRDDLPALVRKQLLLAVGYSQEEGFLELRKSQPSTQTQPFAV